MSADPDVDILNLVHNLGALGKSFQGATWAEKGALRPQIHTSGSPFSPQPLSTHNRIPQRNRKVFATYGAPLCTNRRIQPVSVPRRPPDLQNAALFPSIGESLADNAVPDRRQSFPPTASESNAKIPNGFSPQDRKLKKLENKFTLSSSNSNDVNITSNGFGSPSPVFTSKVKPKKYSSVSTIVVHKSPSPTSSENSLPVKQETRQETPSAPRKTPRSAELFAELTPEIMQEVDKLAHQYSSVLDNNICYSVLDEITLLLRLVALGSGGLGNTEFKQLSTRAQQVYFVIKVLSLQLNSSLSSIDPSVIQILIQKYPHRIPRPVRKHFESWVSEQVRLKSESQLAELAKSPPPLTSKPSEFHNCVTFRSETDGRANFPNQGDFHAFCKQRDLFYAIKTLWNEKKAAEPAFVVSQSRDRDTDALYSKIKALFHLSSSWANLSHLAALFTSQFILDAIEDLQKKEKEANKPGVYKDDEMRSLIESNPDKFAKLRNRMSMGTANESLKESLSFSKYFLGIASSPAFNEHLNDRLSYEIIQVESFIENSVNVPSKEIISLVRKTVLLSQLLGYVTFLPYSNEGTANRGGSLATLEKEALMSAQAQLRSHQQPPLDIESKLNAAVSQSRLTFTVPWVIEFLLAADSISLQLPSYQRVIKLIFTIYRTCLADSSKTKIISLRNRNFLRFWCGKLLSTKIAKDIELDTQGELAQSDIPSVHLDEEFLDSYAKIGESLVEVYFAMEFQEMKSMLQEGLDQQQHIEKGITVSIIEPKHIRPIPAGNKRNVEQAKQRQLQCQLESSFFDSNPPSVKKTVDFISERIASNYVKTLRGLLNQIRCELAIEDKFELEAAVECKNRMLSQLEQFCKAKCYDSVAVLIGESSISGSALTICQDITYRYCSEKIAEWTENHIKPEMFPVISSDDITVMKKKQSDAAPVSSTQQTTETPPVCEDTFSRMIRLHRASKKLHKKKTLTEEEVDSILFSTAIESCCSDVMSTLVDFGMALIAFVPELVTSERQQRLIFLWKKSWNPDYKILCARNLLMIQDNYRSTSGPQNAETWKVLTSILAQLVKEDIITLEELEQDCFRLLREDWAPTVSAKVSALLREIAKSAKRSTVNDEDSKETIDWIAWYCSDEPDDNF